MEEIYCKYYKQNKQISDDYGQTWQNTRQYRKGELYESDSDDCTYSPSPMPPDGYSNKYLTFVFEVPQNELGGQLHIDGIFVNTGYYSIDSGVTWERGNSEYIPYGRYLHSGDTIMLKAEITPASGYTYKVGTFTPTKNAHVEGNVMSLIYGDNFVGKTTIPKGLNFSHLFDSEDFGHTTVESQYLTNAEHIVLPATSLTDNCYFHMFYNTSIVKGPKILPAGVLKENCYYGMFSNCKFLTAAPELPAIKLLRGCYDFMFYLCQNLNYIKCLAKYSIGGECGTSTKDWLYHVAESGTFVKRTDMPYNWPTGGNGIPSGWTVIDAT